MLDHLLCRDYEVSIANHPFLFDETLICARLLLEHGEWEAVARAVLENSMFRTRSAATAQTYLRAIRFRLEQVPTDLLQLMNNYDESTARLSLFYIMLQKNRLLREFMEETVRDLWLEDKNELPRDTAEAFFADKRQQSPVLKEWSDSTWRKFWQNTLKAPQEAGLLQGQDPLMLMPSDIEPFLRDWLLARRDGVYLELMLDPEAFAFH